MAELLLPEELSDERTELFALLRVELLCDERVPTFPLLRLDELCDERTVPLWLLLVERVCEGALFTLLREEEERVDCCCTEPLLFDGCELLLVAGLLFTASRCCVALRVVPAVGWLSRVLRVVELFRLFTPLLLDELRVVLRVSFVMLRVLDERELSVVLVFTVPRVVELRLVADDERVVVAFLPTDASGRYTLTELLLTLVEVRAERLLLLSSVRMLARRPVSRSYSRALGPL